LKQLHTLHLSECRIARLTLNSSSITSLFLTSTTVEGIGIDLQLPNLKKIDICELHPGWVQLGGVNYTIDSMAENCQLLETLEARSCRALSTKLPLVTKNCKNIKYLALDIINFKDDRRGAVDAIKELDKLVHLSVRCCALLDTFEAELLLHFPHIRKKLNSWDLLTACGLASGARLLEEKSVRE